jgi:hypothetical protein
VADGHCQTKRGQAKQKGQYGSADNASLWVRDRW